MKIKLMHAQRGKTVSVNWPAVPRAGEVIVGLFGEGAFVVRGVNYVQEDPEGGADLVVEVWCADN